ncbi:hypothetical protein [Streptomyces mirabilis]|uniref:hypothetical protein n=1 Tax=Streptomyces mirabilis TaxID=68239 RepID=UPI0036AEE660
MLRRQAPAAALGRQGRLGQLEEFSLGAVDAWTAGVQVPEAWVDEHEDARQDPDAFRVRVWKVDLTEVRNEPKKRYESRTVVLETREVTPRSVLPAIDASGQPILPCHFFGQPTSIRNTEDKPEHYSCRQRQGAPS